MKKRRAGGFSLIELLIVMAIAGVVLAVATPNYLKYRDNANLKEAANQIAGEIAFWRQSAIAENVRYRIVFNQSANSYTIQRENPANSGIYVNLSAINASVTDTRNLADVSNSISIMGSNPPNFSGGVAFITIQPRGTMSGGTVWLQHTTRLSTSTITTNLMGRVNVAYNLK